MARVNRVKVEQAVERGAELQLAPEAHQAREHPVGPVRDAVDRPDRRDLGDDRERHREPLDAEPEDEQGRVVDRPPLGGPAQQLGPLGQVALGGPSTEEPPRAPGEDRAVPAVDVLLELRTGPVAVAPIRFQQSSTRFATGRSMLMGRPSSTGRDRPASGTRPRPRGPLSARRAGPGRARPRHARIEVDRLQIMGLRPVAGPRRLGDQPEEEEGPGLAPPSAMARSTSPFASSYRPRSASPEARSRSDPGGSGGRSAPVSPFLAPSPPGRGLG